MERSKKQKKAETESEVVVDLPTDKKDKKAEKKGCCGKKKKAKMPMVPFGVLLRYDEKSQWLVGLGFIFSIISGAVFPLFSLVFGSLFNDLFTLTGDALAARISFLAIMFVVLGVGAFLTTYLRTLFWTIYGERVSRKMRRAVFSSLLEQEIGYFDQAKTGDLISKISGDIDVISNGVSDKLGIALNYLTQVVAGLIIAFISGWKMTLVMLATSPAMIAAGALQARFFAASMKRSQKHTGKASQVVQETVSGIRTVYSFVAEMTVIKRFNDILDNIYKFGVKKSHMSGVTAGFAFLFMFCVYALGFWYGGQLIIAGEMLPGDMLTVFFAIVIGAMGIGMASQITPDVAKAQGAAVGVFEIINRKTLIDVQDGTGRRLEDLKGVINFNDVKFYYPTRKEAMVLKGLKLEVKPGQTVALVGPSGGGKSTVIQLLERFYDPIEGSVMVDGVDVKEFDLRWLRSQIGLVSQEPILFEGSIAENIRYGKIDATDEEVMNAAKMANAHTFITTDLEGGYDCAVGERGAQLSGGQKQRVAIARAILKNPKILLLDEATSALDTESEALVQDALDKLMVGRTTIVIAHRLTTVRNADVINVINKGQLLGSGSHDQLVAKNGFYARLIHRQMRSKQGDEDLGGWVNPDDFDDVNTKKTSSSSDKESILTGHVPLDEVQPVLVADDEKTRLKDSTSSSSSSSTSGDDNNV